MLPKVMTVKGALKYSVSIEETLLNLNKFQLITFQGDNIFQYYMAINSDRPSGVCLSSEVQTKNIS